MDGLIALIKAVGPIVKISEGLGCIRDEFPALNTEEINPEKFWDSLNHGKYFMLCGKRYYDNKHQVGAVALHQGLMSANYGWNGWNTKFKNLDKRQQKIIQQVLSYKNEPYTVISIPQIAKGLFND